MGLVNAKLRRILLDHAGRYPAMQVRDVYKLIIQAAMGNEHAVRDEAEARAWLEAELSQLGQGPEEPLFDPISPDGRFVRIHLRPYVQAGKDPQALLRAFVDSSRVASGSRDLMVDYLQKAISMCPKSPLAIEKSALESFFSDMEARDFPAAHHSDEYRRLYRPAYRLVAAELVKELT
jgi:hypothetical protein